ncbi:oxidoreductase [Oceanobacillus jeddahense]|uniref:oxidoreductase n=1 Tax=Oceanobacillus jeddahense TaxID=1462527 RepID=UPI00362EB5AB
MYKEKNVGSKTSFKNLYSPLKIGSREVKNRIVSTAHAVGFDDGVLNEKHVRYHERKAKGGAGLIMTFGSASVYKESSASYGSVSLWNPENEPYLKDLAERVHAQGALIMSQATHMGRRGTSVVDGRPVHAPSAVPEGVHREIPHVMRTEEIPPIVRAFADSAVRLERCGWDGIEITSFGGHLIEQFWSPKINNRTDRYGGDFEGRMRFTVEVVKAVREAVSSNFIIGFRMAGDLHTKDLGLDETDMLEIAKKLDSLDCIDLFNISGGTGATYRAQAAVVPGDTFKRGVFNHLAKRMKEQLSVPIIAAGRNLDPHQAEDALVAEDCDLVGMTRAIIADPDMPNLAQKGELSKIRPCIACNEGCIGRVYSGMSMICTVNPAIADDSLDDFEPAKKKRQVVVVGGGPSGMEAARVTAIRGHNVVVLERTGSLGGKVSTASIAKERPHYGRHIEWLKKELERLNVEVHTNTKGTIDSILEFHPDAVVLAIGSTPILPQEVSEGDARFVTDIDLLNRKINVGSDSKVLIYDREGKYRGGSIANFAAKEGALKVELATPIWSVCEDLDEMQKAEMYRLLAKNNIKLSPNQYLSSQEGNRFFLQDIWSGDERTLEEKEIIVLVGYELGDNKLYEELSSNAPKMEVQLIGDAVSPRRLSDAVSEGVRVGNVL